MTELDLETEVIEEPTVPCYIKPHSRRAVCGHDDEHPADVRVIGSCGCVFAYCDRAVTWLGVGMVWCDEGHPDQLFIIVAVEPLR